MGRCRDLRKKIFIGNDELQAHLNKQTNFFTLNVGLAISFKLKFTLWVCSLHNSNLAVLHSHWLQWPSALAQTGCVAWIQSPRVQTLEASNILLGEIKGSRSAKANIGFEQNLISNNYRSSTSPSHKWHLSQIPTTAHWRILRRRGNLTRIRLTTL